MFSSPGGHLSPMSMTRLSFTDESGAPFPGGIFPGSPNTNITGLTDVSNDSQFGWDASRVTIARGGSDGDGLSLSILEGGDENSKTSSFDSASPLESQSSQEVQPSVSVMVQDGSNQSEEAKDGAGDGVQNTLTAEMAGDMFRRISGAAYSTSAFIFGDPQHQNPLISLQVPCL